ncbi:MAG: ribosomal protein S18-alanine N-acetyltransferase [Eubacteriales bacterium]
MEIEIKLAGREHLAAISALEEATFAEPWSESALELFVGEDNFAVVAISEDRLLSYCTVTAVLDEAQIINVATDKEHRGKGYAKRVLESVIDECQRRGTVYLSLEVRASNAGAVSLYENLGFSVSGNRKDFYRAPREDALVMIKNLE